MPVVASNWPNTTLQKARDESKRFFIVSVLIGQTLLMHSSAGCGVQLYAPLQIISVVAFELSTHGSAIVIAEI
jgi:hypothetical protein